MSQTQDYKFTLDPAVAGQLSDIRPKTVVSRFATETIPFGAGLARLGEDGVEVLDNVSKAFVGVAIRTLTKENPLNNGVLGGSAAYKETETVNVLRSGAVWVEVTASVTQDTNAYVDVSTAGGFFTGSAGGNVLAGKFLSSASAGELAILEVKI